jgi:fatty-acyl-CoA synthase
LQNGDLHRYKFKDFFVRVKKLANLLKSYGVKKGDRIATFSFNNYQHLELYFAIPLIGNLFI